MQSEKSLEMSLQIGRLGRADSDFTSFLHHAGVPSLDMYFGKGMQHWIRAEMNAGLVLLFMAHGCFLYLTREFPQKDAWLVG